MAFSTDLIQATSTFKVKVSGTDTTSDYLLSKLLAGSGISITQNNIGGNETLTFATTGVGGVQVVGEVVTFSGTSGTLAFTPIAGTVALYRGGGRTLLGAGNDYTISGANITLLTAAASGEVFQADYEH